MNKLLQSLNTTQTENGALAYAETGSAVLDLFSKGGVMRAQTSNTLKEVFSKAFKEDKLLATKCMFHLRNCRGGQGERRVFREFVRWASDKYPDIIKKNIHLIPIYGRWDDIFECFNTLCEYDALKLIKDQFFLDIKKLP